jgi:hypothetical protein
VGSESRANLSIGEHPFVDGPFVRPLGLLRLPFLTHGLAARALAVISVTWIPLAILAAIQEHAITDVPRNSFLMDPVSYARFMLAIPFLLFAEKFCIPVLAQVVRNFGDRGLIREADREEYENLLSATRARLTSRSAEIVLLILVILQTLGSAFGVSGQLVEESWRGYSASGAAVLSYAGWYATLVSSPIYLLILYGWGWRLLLWGHCLFKLSKFDLRLQPNHPDHVGGLGFVLQALSVLPLLGFALTVAPAGGIADLMLFANQPLETLKPVIIGFCVVVLLVMVGPLLFFSMPLNRVRTEVLGRNSRIAFDQRTPESESRDPDEMGAGAEFDIAAKRFVAASQMKTLLVDLKQLPPVMLGILLPFLPVLLIDMPLKDILEKLKGILL